MPKAVTALGGKYWLKDNSETPDTLQVGLDYGTFLGSWEHRTNNTEATKARLLDWKQQLQQGIKPTTQL